MILHCSFLLMIVHVIADLHTHVPLAWCYLQNNFYQINSNGAIGAKNGKAFTLSCQTLIFLERSQTANLFSVFERQQNVLYNMSHN